VLRRAAAPAILFEAGYISNADDEVMLRDPERRKAIVLALAQAIEADVATRSRVES
jgi:N-acetylmuramoyl-L-alanine amidase